VCERHRHDALADIERLERLVEERAPTDADRPEGEELVPVAGLGHPRERAEDVVAHAGPWMRERRDVVRDPHGAV
jgi:hypothetical protein